MGGADHSKELLTAVQGLRDSGVVAARCHVIAVKTNEQGSWSVSSLHTRSCCGTALKTAKRTVGHIAHVTPRGTMCCFFRRGQRSRE